MTIGYQKNTPRVLIQEGLNRMQYSIGVFPARHGYWLPQFQKMGYGHQDNNANQPPGDTPVRKIGTIL